MINIPKNQEFVNCIDIIPNSIPVLNSINIDNFSSSNIKFIQEDTLFYYIPQIIPHKYVALFDIDWTMTYAEQAFGPHWAVDDIHILPQRKETIIMLIKSGYTIVFISNQKAKTKPTIKKKCDRISNFLHKLHLPCYALIATGDDIFSKPNIGMWEKVNQLIPDIKYAFYVGDALGRKKDYADVDKEFAINANIPYYSPEEFFPLDKVELPSGKNMVITVGLPGAGKSSFINKYLSPLGFKHLSRDKLNLGKEAFQKIVLTTAKQGFKDIAVDATNLSIENRKIYYEIAKLYNYSVTILYFVRDAYGWNKLRDKPIPKIVYYKLFKDFDPPSIEKDKHNVILINNF